MAKPSDKSVNYLIYIFENSKRESIIKTWERVPKNNSRYPDTRADYRRAIFKDYIIARATQKQVSYLIELITRGFRISKIREVLRSL